MVTTVQKWGNSQGLRLARKLLEEARISVGDDVDVSVQQGLIIITPIRRVRGRVRLEDLVARIPRGRRPRAVDWGKPVGREEW
jgi:antitoxin MazE